jgi:hypothetical protein
MTYLRTLGFGNKLGNEFPHQWGKGRFPGPWARLGQLKWDGSVLASEPPASGSAFKMGAPPKGWARRDISAEPELNLA